MYIAVQQDWWTMLQKCWKKKIKLQKTKSGTGYCMRREQIEAWYKDDAFKLWDTADAKPPKYQIKCITWLEMSKLEEIFRS